MSDNFGGYRPVSLTAPSPTGGSGGNSPSSVLQESLVEEVPSNLVATTIQPLMEVVAPATLPEGYEFQVELNGSKYSVKVPAGGVEKGQTFSVPFPEAVAAQLDSRSSSIPVGHWRDGLTDCFRYGICHPHCWASWLCTFLATAQVIRRMQFDFLGRPTEDTQARAMAFPIIAAMVVGYFTIHFALWVAMVSLDPNLGHEDDEDWEEIDPPAMFYAVQMPYRFFGIVYWVTSTVILIRTRRSVRERFAIPGEQLEDCLCGVCCHCCVAGQLLRHTTDYDVHPSTIFTDTGLPPHVQAIV